LLTQYQAVKFTKERPEYNNSISYYILEQNDCISIKMTKHVMTSDKQVLVLRSLEYLACYYITGSYMTQDYGYYTRVKHFRDLTYAVSFLPYYWRAMQVYNPSVPLTTKE